MAALGVRSKAGEFFTANDVYLKVIQDNTQAVTGNEFDLKISCGKFEEELDRKSYLRNSNKFYTKLDNIQNAEMFRAELEGNFFYYLAVRQKRNKCCKFGCKQQLTSRNVFKIDERNALTK